MSDPRFSVEVVVRQRVKAAVGPLVCDPLHVLPVKAVIASEGDRSLQEEAPIGHLPPHVEVDFLPLVNWQPDPLQRHVLNPRLRRRSALRPKPC